MISHLLIPFFTICISEFADKTQIAIFLLSAKTKNYLKLFSGVILAFVIVDGFAIFLGYNLGNIIPKYILKISSSLIFILVGIFLLFEGFKKNKGENNIDKFHSLNPFLSGFLTVFLTEWGDKTQITAVLFSVKFKPVLVFLGTIMALASLSLIAIYFGKIVSEKVNKKVISVTGGIIFLAIGIFFFFIN